MCEQTREHSGEGSFLKKHKIQVKGKGSELVVYDSGLPSGRVIMNSVKAADHSLQIQKQQLIQGKKCLSISARAHYQQDQRGYVSK